ncbi:MAG: hypothetical protein C0606_00240 [Hyphomicrobiales bacterium]|nr:MAG: hypothetical protein C0606_00240 [Hyphomicrobiales bacterium]
MVDQVAGSAGQTNVRPPGVEADKAALERRQAAQEQAEKGPEPQTAEVGSPAAIVQNASSVANRPEAAGDADPVTRLVSTIAKGAEELGIDPAVLIGTLASESIDTGRALLTAIEEGNGEGATKILNSASPRPTREYGNLIDMRV